MTFCISGLIKRYIFYFMFLIGKMIVKIYVATFCLKVGIQAQEIICKYIFYIVLKLHKEHKSKGLQV